MPIALSGAAAAAATPPAPRAPAGARFGVRLEAHLRPALATPAPPPLVGAIRGLEAAQARLDGVLAAARRGQVFTAGELLALQGEAHRFTQTLDLAGKLVEQGVQGLKQVVNTPL